MTLLINILLSIIGLVGFVITSIIGFNYAWIKAVYLAKYKALYYYISSIFRAIAKGFDILGCVVLAPYLNRYFITQDSIWKFGSDKTTISFIIGKNYCTGTLLTHSNPFKSGMYWYNFLEKTEKGHCQLAIMDFETKEIYLPPYMI